MSERKDGAIDLNAAQRRLAETLKGIGSDLWGTENPDIWAEKAFEEAATPAGQRKAGTAAPGHRTAGIAGRKGEKIPDRGDGKNAGEPKEKGKTIDTLWITADETVDWTEALIYERPRDGLTPMPTWRFCHRMARKVLDGDRDAYVEVLQTMNPLGDLTDYVSGMIIRTPSPDRLECVFECREELLEGDARKYLGALGLRIGRDLLAVLPVEEVRVTGRQGDTERLNVTWKRSQLLKQKMAFLDPAEFTEACGGVIAD